MPPTRPPLLCFVSAGSGRPVTCRQSPACRPGMSPQNKQPAGSRRCAAEGVWRLSSNMNLCERPGSSRQQASRDIRTFNIAAQCTVAARGEWAARRGGAAPAATRCPLIGDIGGRGRPERCARRRQSIAIRAARHSGRRAARNQSRSAGARAEARRQRRVATLHHAAPRDAAGRTPPPPGPATPRLRLYDARPPPTKEGDATPGRRWRPVLSSSRPAIPSPGPRAHPLHFPPPPPPPAASPRPPARHGEELESGRAQYTVDTGAAS
ncbi:atherin-like [Schistocerca americana]|uniref:atherin-like n=1 Tax=Schistocerca americana TaxID=7009 RepID=UPI001F5026B5|nr:atherin-like [Schistocerca americana]